MELELFKGTNLYGAALDRKREWQEEYTQCQNAISKANGAWGASFTWERYLAAATYLSSRAFPSSLLAPNPTLLSRPSTEPVLIAGIDLFNHARGAAVTWAVSYPDLDSADPSVRSQKEPVISLVLHGPTEPGQELFNNYGPKPNSELILGYGFSLPDNPDDTIILKIGGINGERWEIGRAARGVEGLWDEIIRSLESDSDDNPSYEDQLEAAGLLTEMVQDLLKRLPKTSVECNTGMRPDVNLMLRDYVQGQRDILESLIEFTRRKEQDAIAVARAEGIELVFED
ncbi:hypothetical protein AX17_001014 [Amanita inopinata Kibby_2008]|nr:hypothetical protein AX17_001014 [Amanita inopinata Kibby_2008]